MKPSCFFKFMITFLMVTDVCLSTSFGQTSSTTSTDGIQIMYEVRGEGTPVLVFVHGWSCDRTYWKGQLESFAEKYKVVAIDLAGHGESGLGRNHWTMEAFGEDVAAVVKALNLKNVIMIGHSMGSVVIAESAQHLPGRVAGLVMVDQYKNLGAGMTTVEVETFVTRFQAHFKDSTNAFVRRMFVPSSDSSLVEWVATDMSSAPTTVALEALESTLNYSRRMPQTLTELQLPVVAINDNRNPTDFASMKQYGVEVIIMKGVGHFLMMEDPKKFNKLLEAALTKITK